MVQEKRTVSVVIPNYNHARFLRKRIESVLGQTYQDFELILLDDCSTDESRTILEEYAPYSRVRLEFNQVNSGSPFKQWNKGVRLAQGKYAWIAESDDYADARFLERMVRVLDENAKVQFAFCRSWCVTEDNRLEGFADTLFEGLGQNRWAADFCVEGREECRNFMVHSNVVQNASAVLFRRAAYEEAGGADGSMRLCGDWILWASMMLMGDVGYVAEPLNYFRFHGGSVRQTTDLTRRDVAEWLRAVRWILDRVTPPDDVLEKVYEHQAHRWVPVLLSPRVPLKVKLDTLRCARAVDPHPVRSALRPVLATVQAKIRRHWRELRSMISPAGT
jgi:glycosyltransferase involved in cell wall biosynthesis